MALNRGAGAEVHVGLVLFDDFGVLAFFALLDEDVSLLGTFREA